MAEQEEQATTPRRANIMPRVRNIAACRSRWIGATWRAGDILTVFVQTKPNPRVSVLISPDRTAFKELSCRLNKTERICCNNLGAVREGAAAMIKKQYMLESNCAARYVSRRPLKFGASPTKARSSTAGTIRFR